MRVTKKWTKHATPENALFNAAYI